MSERIHYIDWLRVLAVLLLFPFHVSRVFNAGEPFYVKSEHVSAALGWLLGFINVWHMPLLFFLAGASSYFALRRRSGGQYVSERVKRLLVPFLFGWLVLIPPQTWYGARFNEGYSESFVHYLVSGDFLAWNIRDGGDYYGGFGLGHLWFILWLFAISLAALPLMSWGRERGRERLERLSRRIARPSWWLLPALTIFIGEAMPDPVGKNVFYYLVVFVLGYIAMTDAVFSETAERVAWIASALGAGLSLAWLLTGEVRDALPDPSFARVGLSLIGPLAVWCVIVGAVGLGRRFLDRPSPALSYLGAASYPLYILHQTVIVVLAFYVIALPVGGIVQWSTLLVLSVAATFALYEVARRIPLLRGVLGIRPARRGTPRAPTAATQEGPK